jgi:catechol 2,3-dioxygenase-like lactoylglutathione lyase family enzyme
MTAARLDHVSITTADLERSIAFYRDTLGLELLSTGDAAEPELSDLIALPDVHLRYAELSLGNDQILELLHYVSPTADAITPSPNRPGATHLALAVDDIDIYKRKLDAAAATISRDIITLTEDTDWNGARTLYAHDPDGVTIELIERAPAVIRIPEPEVTHPTAD